MLHSKKATPITVILLFLLAIYCYNLAPLVLSWGPGTNYRNVSVRTTVNVTETYPEILNVSCNSGQNISLNAGTTKDINCLVVIRDYNGGNTINTTNSTFYYYLNASSDPNDNNTHYTNSSCAENSTNGYYTNWTCGFTLLYYANNGTWRANATVKDNYNFTANNSKNATISSLFALNVTTPIDFGNMAVGDTSTSSVPANITNFGNVNINVSVYGFGAESETLYPGYAMICDQRNITVSNERYDLASGTLYDAMSVLTSAPANIAGLRVYQQTDDTAQSVNSTYWRLHVNITNNPFGICNGTVVFAAQ